MGGVDEIEVVVAHSERATLRVGDVFLKVDVDQTNTARRSQARALAARTSATGGSPAAARQGYPAGDTLAQITLMGVRPYNPVTGRFLSVDPVTGGSSNDDDYTCADPVNGLDLDLDGRKCWRRARRACVPASGRGGIDLTSDAPSPSRASSPAPCVRELPP